MKLANKDSQQPTPKINSERMLKNDFCPTGSQKKYLDNGKLYKDLDAPPETSSSLDERLRFHFAPRTPAEQEKYELTSRQAAEKKQRDDRMVEGPLDVYHLSELTAKGLNFDDVNRNNKKEFIRKIFYTLEKNTEKFAGKWTFIKDDCEINSKKTSSINPVVTGRFSDIPLVKNTAIPDLTRPNVYIHANIVDLGVDRKFIATQRPLASEIPGFWKAVNTHAVSLIIDLTNKTDAAKESDWKSYCPTWPFEKRKFDDISVSEKGFAGSATYSNASKGNIKQKSIVIKSAAASHSLERIKFGHWPDKNVVDPELLVNLANHAESLSKDKEGPILIHCRAGVGRTGTLMSFMAAREILAGQKEISQRSPSFEEIIRTVLDVVANGRIARGPVFVQNAEQFELIIKALELHFSEQSHLAMPSNFCAAMHSAGTGASRQRGLMQEANKMQSDCSSPKDTLPSILEDEEPDLTSASTRAPQTDNGTLHEAIASTSMPASESPVIERNLQVRTTSTRVPPRQIKVSVLWQGLKKMFSEKEIDFLMPDEVEDNGTNTPCPRESVVAANIAGDIKKIHANHMHFSPTAAAAATQNLTANNYIAGQAPRDFSACERLLFKSIETRQGIFQIVSERSHETLDGTILRDDGAKSIKSVIEQLLEQTAGQSRDGQPPGPALRIGGRFEFVALDKDRAEQSSSTYLLTVRDTDTLANDCIITIPLTQAGLKFDDKVLEVPEIVSAGRALASHLACVHEHNPDADVEPIVISGAGVGRNATTIVYRQIEALIEKADITTEKELDAVLLREISVGRTARGSRFVHSESQLEQLRAALVALLPVRRVTFAPSEPTFDVRRGVPEIA